MKVLMFGWEFPPHISGGLGTACFGLTKALIRERVDVRFVVPKLFGDETAGSFLINASRVRRALPRRQSGRKAARAASSSSASSAQRSVKGKTRGAITYVELPSWLNPYQHNDKATTRHQQGISDWNYEFSRRTSTQAFGSGAGGEAHTEQHWDAAHGFEFSGQYGKNLLEEVRRYADVAEVLAEQQTFDVIHVHDWMTFLAGVAAKRKSRKPLVVHVHSTEFDRSGAFVNREVVELERLGLENADKVIAVSKWTKDIIVSRYRIPAAKVEVVHNGIQPKGPAEAFTFPNIGSHFITFLGRVTHQKGPWFFVEAAQMVLKEFPEAHFIVAGAGDLLPQIIERVAQLNLSSHFHFTGFLVGDQVDRIWSLTDVYVMPSVSEPFGIAPLEAIQGDVPVILSRQSGVAEVMPHAIKVDFWDIKALAAAICSVLRYESLSTVLRQKSKQHLKRLTWEKAARQVKHLYDELTAP